MEPAIPGNGFLRSVIVDIPSTHGDEHLGNLDCGRLAQSVAFSGGGVFDLLA